jgi:hypothetical protein
MTGLYRLEATSAEAKKTVTIDAKAPVPAAVFFFA